MTVSETLAALKTKKGIVPSADYTGTEKADDFIFAIQTDATTQTKESDWVVFAERVKEHSGALNASTEDVAYIRAGTVTEKGETQRTFSRTGTAAWATLRRISCSPTGLSSAPALRWFSPISTSAQRPARARRAQLPLLSLPMQAAPPATPQVLPAT